MAIFHLSAKTGSRAGGQSARAKIDYLTRGGKYSRGSDEVLHIESGNMPAWALKGRSPRLRSAGATYWTTADLYERENGRLYKHLELALPHELTHSARLDLLRTFAREIAETDDGPLPFTFTMHKGRGKNVHGDVMLSERINDYIPRDPSLWFRRAAASPKKGTSLDPAKGGAKKTDALKSKEWLASVRELWAKRVNEVLARADIDARVDHRSLADQGLDRLPPVHIGPPATAIQVKFENDDIDTPSWRVQYAFTITRSNEEAADSRSLARAAEAGVARLKAEIQQEVARSIAAASAKVDERRRIEADEAAQVQLAQRLMAKARAAKPTPRPVPSVPVIPREIQSRSLFDLLNRIPAKPPASAPAPERRRKPRQVAKPRMYDADRSVWRELRKQIQQQQYGSASDYLAQFWVVKKHRGHLEFTNKAGRIIDSGPVITADEGNALEIQAMLELAKVKGWSRITFTGSDDFKARAMLAAIESGFDVNAETHEDRAMLKRVKAKIRPL